MESSISYTGSISGKGRLGGLVGVNFETVTGYATGRVNGNPIFSSIDGLIGFNNSIFDVGYWDRTSTGRATSAGGSNVVGITSIANVAWNTNTNSYEDTGNGSTTVFNHTDFINAFTVMKDNPGDSMWPKLKTNIFSFPQPDLP